MSNGVATRLDRLRSGLPGRGAAAAGVRPQALDRPVTAAQQSPAALAAALGGRLVDGVVQITRDWQMQDKHAQRPDGLDRLPEVFGSGEADWVYLDTETTGLSGGVGTLAFMVGVARYRAQGGLQVKQFVLAGFAAEHELLRQVLDYIGGKAVVVSYNGKCFDLPLLQARLALQRIDFDLAGMQQLDLMYSVRRAFRRHWPDCRLQTAERRLLDFVRHDDLPGAEAPATWQAWLRQSATRPLSRVAEHNFFDLVSLARLHRLLPAVYDGRYTAGMDNGAVGRAWQRVGLEQHARALWESGGTAMSERDNLELAAAYRRAGEWRRAESLWLRLFGAGNRAAASELSKFYEHRMRDLPRACKFAEACVEPERSRRLDRLQRKLADNCQLSLWPPGSAANAMK